MNFVETKSKPFLTRMDRHPSAAFRPAWPTRVLWLTPTKTKGEEVSPATPMRQELRSVNLDLLAEQVCVEGMCERIFPDSTERMGPKRNELVGLRYASGPVGFMIYPDIGVGASDKA